MPNLGLPLTDSDPFPFGQHKGTKMANMPASYLKWLLTWDGLKHYPDIRAYINDNMLQINQEINLANRRSKPPLYREGD